MNGDLPNLPAGCTYKDVSAPDVGDVDYDEIIERMPKKLRGRIDEDFFAAGNLYDDAGGPKHEAFIMREIDELIRLGRVDPFPPKDPWDGVGDSERD